MIINKRLLGVIAVVVGIAVLAAFQVGGGPSRGQKTMANSAPVTIASDQSKILVTPDSVALPANQSVNVAQINAVTPLMGNGATGTGSPRVTVASDNSAIPAAGQGATGAAPPAGATQAGFLFGDATTGGHLKAPIECDLKVVYDASTNGVTNIVAKAASQNIYVCGYAIFSAGTVNVKLISGTLTTTACDTSVVVHTPAYQLIAQTGIVDNHVYGNAFKVATNTDLCLSTSAGVAVQALVYYTQF